MPVQYWLPLRFVLLALLSISPSTQSPVPDIPTATEAIITTLTLPGTTSYSVATLATVVYSTVVKEDIETLTTKIDGSKTTITTDLGPTTGRTKTLTSGFTTSYPYISSETVVNTIGSTTLYGPDTTTSSSSSSISETSSATTTSETSSSSIPQSTTSSNPLSLTTSNASVAGVTTNPASSTPSTISSASSTSSSSSSFSTAAKIGIAVPCTLIIVCGILAAFWMGQRARRNRNREYAQMDWHLEKSLGHEGGALPGSNIAMGEGYRRAGGFTTNGGGTMMSDTARSRADTTFRLTIPATAAGSDTGKAVGRSNTVRTRNSTLAEMQGDEPRMFHFSWGRRSGRSSRYGRDGEALR